MTTLVPNSQASGVEAYEDMFKEITKKLYGEEASQSLHTPMAHAALDVERSFTNLVSEIFVFVQCPVNGKGKVLQLFWFLHS